LATQPTSFAKHGKVSVSDDLLKACLRYLTIEEYAVDLEEVERKLGLIID